MLGVLVQIQADDFVFKRSLMHKYFGSTLSENSRKVILRWVEDAAVRSY